MSIVATAYLLEGLERMDLSDPLAKLDAPHPVTPHGRPTMPTCGGFLD